MMGSMKLRCRHLVVPGRVRLSLVEKIIKVSIKIRVKQY